MTATAPIIRRSEIPNIHGNRVFNPFPGLRPFGPNEADLFFGRETHIEELLQRLASSRFVAVVGTSGSGKSSLVMAGALPRLDGGFRTSFGSFWRVARMRPGDDPIGNLAVALASGSASTDKKQPDNPKAIGRHDIGAIQLALIETGLNRSRLGLIRTAAEIGLDKRENLLVVVDQFEEIFRFRELRQDAHRDTAAAFVNLLLAAAKQTDIPVYVLITMRSDFLGECVQFRGLPEAINKGQYLIPLLNRRQRQTAIEGPAGVAGASVSCTLLQRLLNDAGNMTDQLPVLQHALMRTFDIWLEGMDTDRAIELTDYEEAGGTDSALAKHADEACQELNVDELRVAKVMFQCLADRSRDGRWVRRPCRLAEILAVAGTDMATLEHVIDTFTAHARSFLVLQPEAGELTPDTVVDLSHESLMRLWKTLQIWGEAEVRASDQLQLLFDAALRYEQEKGGLWTDPELALTLKWQEEKQPNQIWANRYGIDYKKVQAFIRKSREVRDLRAAELEHDRMARLEQAQALAVAEQEKGEIERQKADIERHRAEEEQKNAARVMRYAKRLRRWIVAVVLLAVVALSIAGFAYYQKMEAESQKMIAEQEKAKADRARLDAESQKATAEAEKKKAEQQKAAAEAEKRKANIQKEEAEQQKAAAETERKKAETATAAAILARKRTETAMRQAEQNRRRADRERREKKRLEDKLVKEAEAEQMEREEKLRRAKEIEEAEGKIPKWK